MRRTLLLFCYCICASISFGQQQRDEAKIIIIGTVHTGNKAFDHKDLYQALEKISVWIAYCPFPKDMETGN
jgi:hypothetical protein